MGADLCGYLLVGPPKIHKKNIAKAERMFAAIKFWVDNVEQAKELLLANPNINPKDAKKDIHLMALCRILDYANAIHGIDDTDPTDALQIIDGIDDTLIPDFITLWDNKGGWRDLAVRTVRIGGKLHQCIFAGEMTWGDGPTEGSAWHLCETICGLGLDLELGLL